MQIVADPNTYRPRRPLSVTLIQEGILSPEEVEEARAVESRTGETLGEFVLRTRPTDEEELGRLLAQEWGLPFVTAAEMKVDARAIERLPLTVARELGAVPIGFGGGTLVVAVTRPRQALFSRIEDELGETSFVVVSCSVLESLLAQPGETPSSGDRPEALPGRELESDVRAARETLAVLVELQAELAAAQNELSRLRKVERDLQHAREELTQLRAVQDELSAARADIARLRPLEGSLRSAGEELTRLNLELATRDNAIEVARQLHERDIDTIRGLELNLSSRESSTKHAKSKNSKSKQKKAGPRNAKSKRRSCPT